MDCMSRWRLWIRPLGIVLYICVLIIALPLCVWELNRANAAAHTQAWFAAGLFVFMTLPISFWGILQHLVNYTQPTLQRHIIRLLWMVPIYSLNAWFGIRFPSSAIYLDTLRECYEAYVIYNFMIFLLNYLNAESSLEDTLRAKPQVSHLFPANYILQNWSMGKNFVENCKHGTLQYTVVRPVTTAIALIAELSGVYKEGEFTFSGAWLYVMFINNISQIFAMYCLVLFYHACKEELKPMKPLGKFLCVKAVVFASFWQSVLIAILVAAGVITENNAFKFYDVKSIAAGLQDFLICIEMFVAAVAHYYSFSHQPYVDPRRDANASCFHSFMSMFDVSDMQNDLSEHVRVVGRRVRGSIPRGLRARDGQPAGRAREEDTQLLDDSFTQPSYNTAPHRQAVVFTQMRELPPSKNTETIPAEESKPSSDTDVTTDTTTHSDNAEHV